MKRLKVEQSWDSKKSILLEAIWVVDDNLRENCGVYLIHNKARNFREIISTLSRNGYIKVIKGLLTGEIVYEESN